MERNLHFAYWKKNCCCCCSCNQNNDFSIRQAPAAKQIFILHWCKEYQSCSYTHMFTVSVMCFGVGMWKKTSVATTAAQNHQLFSSYSLFSPQRVPLLLCVYSYHQQSPPAPTNIFSLLLSLLHLLSFMFLFQITFPYVDVGSRGRQCDSIITTDEFWPYENQRGAKNG